LSSDAEADPVRTPQSVALAAGVLASMAGFAVFLAVHAVWIVPIWFVAPVGVLIAATSGLCVGWAYDVHRERMAPSLPLRVVIVFVAATLVLLPAVPIALLIAPVDLMSRSMDASRGVTALALFFVIATTVGAAGGALVGRTRRAAGVTALAAFGLAVGIGHNAPLFGDGWPALKLWTIMLTATGISSLTLIGLDAVFVSRLKRRLVGSAAARTRDPHHSDVVTAAAATAAAASVSPSRRARRKF
jgi:hypothetical protein